MLTRILAGSDLIEGDELQFLVPIGRDFDVATIDERMPTESVLLLLIKRRDGRLTLAGSQGLLVDNGDEVVAPLVEGDPESSFSKDARQFDTLEDAGREAEKGRKNKEN